MEVTVYEEALLPVETLMTNFFGQASNPAVYDLAIIFSWITLFIFIFCILSLPFRRRR